jgi:hypothetical protein
MGVMAAGGVGAFMLARSLLGRLGPWGRTLVGGAGGLLLGGGLTDALMGALLGRGFGGSNSAAMAVGAAGAAAGATWASRFWTAAKWLGRMLRSTLVWGAVAFVATEIIEHWEQVKTRLLAIFDEIRQAAPTWLGGDGKGWRAIAEGQGIAGAHLGFRNWLREQGVLTTPDHFMPEIATQLNDEIRREQQAAAERQRPWWGRPPWEVIPEWIQGARRATDAPASAAPAHAPTGTVTMGNITNNITVNVAGTNASAQMIGEAAGNAVQSGLRGALSDLPPMP